jgi:hypothetical protein
MVAHRQRETRNFLQLAFAAALEAENWPWARMEEIIKLLQRGGCIRVKVAPTSGMLEDLLFLAGEEGKQGACLEKIKKEDGTVAKDPGQIETGFTSYF